MIQAVNGTNRTIKSRQNMSKMGQMITKKRHKGTKLSKSQLSKITAQEKASWTERSTATTRLKERD